MYVAQEEEEDQEQERNQEQKQEHKYKHKKNEKTKNQKNKKHKNKKNRKKKKKEKNKMNKKKKMKKAWSVSDFLFSASACDDRIASSFPHRLIYSHCQLMISVLIIAGRRGNREILYLPALAGIRRCRQGVD